MMSILNSVADFLNANLLILIVGLVAAFAVFLIFWSLDKRWEIVPGRLYFPTPVPTGEATPATDRHIAEEKRQWGWATVGIILLIVSLFFLWFLIDRAIDKAKQPEEVVIQAPPSNPQPPAFTTTQAPAPNNTAVSPDPNLTATPKSANEKPGIFWPDNLDKLRDAMLLHDSREPNPENHYLFYEDGEHGIRRFRLPFSQITPDERPKFERKARELAGHRYTEIQVKYVIPMITPLYTTVRLECVGKLAGRTVEGDFPFAVSLPDYYNNLEVNGYIKQWLSSVQTRSSELEMKHKTLPTEKPGFGSDPTTSRVIDLPKVDPKEPKKDTPTEK